MNNQKEDEDDNNREEEQKVILGIDCKNKEYQEGKKDEVIDNHEERNPEESDEEAFEDFGNGGESGGIRDGFGSIEGGDGENDRGGGEKGESKEEDEVTELKSKELGPSMAGLNGIGKRVLELDEKGVGEEGVG